MDECKRKQIIEVLLCPIESVRYSSGKVKIWRENNMIKSTQTYYPYKRWNGKDKPILLDEDMSDFSVGFYEIVYKSILCGNPIINKENDRLIDTRFAGDTMNSFETIANLFPEAGKSRKRRTPMSMWPEILQNYKLHYHCLANFWILPIEIGRTIEDGNELCKASYEFGIKDYVDRFLYRLLERNDYIKYMNYEEPNMFIDINCLRDCYIAGDGTICQFSDETNPQLLIDQILYKIEVRARQIADSCYAEALWDYFNDNNLINKL